MALSDSRRGVTKAARAAAVRVSYTRPANRTGRALYWTREPHPRAGCAGRTSGLVALGGEHLVEVAPPPGVADGTEVQVAVRP